jgi:hypothetical protein
MLFVDQKAGWLECRAFNVSRLLFAEEARPGVESII